MTSPYAPQGEPASFEQTEPLDSGECIRRTGGSETAAGRSQGRDPPSVEHYTQYRDPPREEQYCANGAVHDRLILESARRMASATSSDVAVAVDARAMSTTSDPGHGPPALRAAALRTLLHRERNTELPIFFPATKARRPEGSRPSGVSARKTTTSGVADRRPVRNTLSISLEDLMVGKALMTPEPRRVCYALRTLRPLRRRAASTARPPRVAMRARKPWVFARFRTLGW